MRHAALLGIVALLPALPAPAADNAPPHDIRYAVEDRVEVRCGPSINNDMYVTNLLHAGAPVEVVGEAPGGWLKILPPPGSFSWVNKKFLAQITPNQPNYVIVQSGTDAKVFVGSELFKGRPGVAGAELKPGTQVVSIGVAKTDEEGEWMPIEPPHAEVRYVRKDKVVINKPASTVVTAAATAATPLTLAQLDELWRRARQAEQAHNIPEAIRLYRQTADAYQKDNPRWSRQALDYARWLEEAYRPSRTGSVPGQLASDTRYRNLPHENQFTGIPGGRVSPLAAGPSTPPTVRLSAPPASNPAVQGGQVAGMPGVGETQFVRYSGQLRRAGRLVDAQKAYALETPAGQPIVYVLPLRGLNLETCVGRNVEIHGTVSYDQHLKVFILTADQVTPPR